MIEYQKKSESVSEIEYENVTLSYNFVTIYADKMLYKKSENLLESIGKSLIVENAIDCPSMKKIKVRVAAENISFECICN